MLPLKRERKTLSAHFRSKDLIGSRDVARGVPIRRYGYRKASPEIYGRPTKQSKPEILARSSTVRQKI